MATNIVLADAQVTPVNHTFTPIGLDTAGTFWWIDSSQANAVGYWRISVKVKYPAPAKSGESSADRTNRIEIGLHEPTLETAGDSSASGILPAPTVAYICRTLTTHILPERGTLQNRKDIRKMNALLQAESQIINYVENLVYPN